MGRVEGKTRTRRCSEEGDSRYDTHVSRLLLSRPVCRLGYGPVGIRREPRNDRQEAGHLYTGMRVVPDWTRL